MHRHDAETGYALFEKRSTVYEYVLISSISLHASMQMQSRRCDHRIVSYNHPIKPRILGEAYSYPPFWAEGVRSTCTISIVLLSCGP